MGNIFVFFLFAVAMIGTAFSTTYLAFLFWTLVNGLVNCLYSGSMEALIYDTLKQEGKESEFDHWTSRMEAVTWVGLSMSVVVGGYLYAVNPEAPYLVQAIVTGVATILAMMLAEPKIDSVKYQLKDVVSKNIAGFGELFKNFRISYLTIIFIIIGFGYYVAADILGISQVREYGLDTKLVGWVFGVGYIISALASHYYPKIKNMFGEMRLVWISAGMLILSFLLAKYVGVWAGVGLIIMRIASSSTFRNSKSIIINREIGSSSRATTLSTLTLLTQLPYAILAIFIGAYIDKTSPNQLAFVLGVGMVGVLVIVQIFIRSYHPGGDKSFTLP